MSKSSRHDVKTRIRKFLEGEAITLSSEEEKILLRWETASELVMKKEKQWVEVRDFIAMRFAVSKHTAENDIVNAQEVFGVNRKINKRFLMHLHLDRLDQDYERARRGVLRTYIDEDTKKLVEIPPDAKELAALARMADAYTYALNSIPQDDDRVKLPPPVYVFKLPDGVSLPVPKLQDLLQMADEYIDYEIIQHGTGAIQPERSAGENEDDAGASHDDQVDQGQ